jgi:hypothetical protein
MEYYRAGELLYLTGAVAEEALEQQKLAMEADERVGLIKDYLELNLPEDWEEKSLSERRQFIHGDFGSGVGWVERDRVCIAEIWCELFRKDLADAKRFEMEELHSLMRQIDGWERWTGNKDGKMRFKLYGVQRAYIKKGSAT